MEFDKANPLGADTPYKYELVGRLHSKLVPPLRYCTQTLLTASEVHSIFYLNSEVTSIVAFLSYHELKPK